MPSRSPALLLALALSACTGATPLLLRTRVDREERVTTDDVAAQRFFARIYGAQRAFAEMELARARASASLARVMELRADATSDLIARALVASLAPDGGVPSTGFRARLSAERHADALQAWSEALPDDARRRAAFEALMARTRVRLNAGRCEHPPRAILEAAAVSRLVLAQSLTAQTLAAEAEALTAQASRGATEGAPALRDEYAAAERWLRSVPVRAELHRQAADQTALWLRGVLNEGPEAQQEVQETSCALP